MASSSTYETDPVGEILDQPAFLNACLRIATAASPSGSRNSGEWRSGPRSDVESPSSMAAATSAASDAGSAASASRSQNERRLPGVGAVVDDDRAVLLGPHAARRRRVVGHS